MVVYVWGAETEHMIIVNFLHLFGPTSILSVSSEWVQHISQLIISLPPYGLRPGWVKAAAAWFCVPFPN